MTQSTRSTTSILVVASATLWASLGFGAEQSNQGNVPPRANLARWNQPPADSSLWDSALGSVESLPVMLQVPAQKEDTGNGKEGGKEGGDDADEGGIKDNSFLIEEAYNQDPGVVQHIFNWIPGWSWEGGRSRTFDFVFTQEWPICSQTHQFSYTIPVSSVFDHPDGQPSTEADGIGDILLNYRYQLSTETKSRPAIAPRFSLILPTGDEDEGLGNGKLGYQFLLPVSKETEHWAFHFNAGLTVTPGVRAGVDPNIPFNGRTLNGYLLGGSAIWLARKDLNFMFEALATWDEALTNTGTEDRTFEMLLSPGVRWAPYTKGDTQWVLGIGLPIGVSPDAPDISIFFYMSIEHPFKEVPKD